ncbi:MAG: sigma-70 family RNA polymerase sigma factor [Synechococcaceae cyanobacterium]|nr:sigma-70 family RNA polymerase sigma factor [Synechococcaceae cyanobacterium]
MASLPSLSFSHSVSPPSAAPTSSRRRSRAAQLLRRRNRLVEQHTNLVPPLAHHYSRCCAEPYEDLRQVGLLGLIRAAERYSPDQGTPFAAFARPHIRGAILHHLRDVAPSVRLPRRQAERLQQLRRQEQGLAPQGRITLAPEEKAVLLRQQALCRPLPLEGALLETLEAVPEAECSPAPHPANAGAVKDLLERLEPRQRRVVSQVVLAGSSYRALAQELGVTPLTVKRLLQQGLESLRQQLESGALSCPAWRHPAPSDAPAC